MPTESINYSPPKHAHVLKLAQFAQTKHDTSQYIRIPVGYSKNNIPVSDKAVEGIFCTNKTTCLIEPAW